VNTAIDQHWSRYYEQGKDFSLISSQTISKFLQHTDTATPQTCLDIGCGTGQLSRELWHRGYKVVGLDIADDAIKQARSLTTVSEDQLTYLHFDIEQDDITTLPLQPYGLITCKLVYAFMHDKPAFLSKVAQLLNKNGTFTVITPLAEHTPPEKRNIAVTEEELAPLQQQFEQIARYDENGLCYFIGKRR
jgi:2-polyprenyl-3-methyl-5-hydroxy-6-metoxy-1,4-benzoquinol methylase